MASGSEKRPFVVIPWRGGCEAREAALAWATDRWLAAGYTVRLGCLEDGEVWCKAEAAMPAIAEAPDGLVIVADADVFCWPRAAELAVISGVAAWAMPHTSVYRLSEASTELVLGGVEPHSGMEMEQRGYDGMPGGGIVVAHRDTLLDVPLDRRFKGWGQEDMSWSMALRTLHGDYWRGALSLFHLWHPPAERWTRHRGSRESWKLQVKYNTAKHRGPEAMRALLEEGA